MTGLVMLAASASAGRMDDLNPKCPSAKAPNNDCYKLKVQGDTKKDKDNYCGNYKGYSAGAWYICTYDDNSEKNKDTNCRATQICRT